MLRGFFATHFLIQGLNFQLDFQGHIAYGQENQEHNAIKNLLCSVLFCFVFLEIHSTRLLLASSMLNQNYLPNKRKFIQLENYFIAYG